METGLRSGLAAVGFLTAVFVCVYFHELGHAFAAAQYGIRTIDITILPIGGLARLERLPQTAKQELWVALAGPAVNIVIALVLGLGLFSTRDLVRLSENWSIQQSFAAQLLIVNVGLAIFNMIPALPMDGGRVLRGLLQFKWSRLQATEIAVKVSRYIAVLFIAVGIFKGFTLCLIGVFVLIAGYQELLAVRLQAWREAMANGEGPGHGPMPGGSVWFRQFEWRGPNQRHAGDTLDAEDVRRIE